MLRNQLIFNVSLCEVKSQFILWLVRGRKCSDKISDCRLVFGPIKFLEYRMSSLKKKQTNSCFIKDEHKMLG